MKKTPVNLQIQPYTPEFRKAFFELNKAWIDQYFKMEPIDYEVLGNPEKYILQTGGTIWVARVNSAAVGVCALMPDSTGTNIYELTKMGVDPAYQGLGIGYALGKAVLQDAQRRGAKRVYLESNTVLEPAIRLYRKLGFREFDGRDSPYQRCNIQMQIFFG